MNITFKSLPLEGLYLCIPEVFEDSRGFFLESFKMDLFLKKRLECNFIQDNQSLSFEGALRGLHYQVGDTAQTKLVRCIDGEIFDVALDIRKNSPTFGKWYGCTLSAENKHQLYIPVGFAHGYVTLSKQSQVLYKISAPYSPKDERGVKWDDPTVDIDWNLGNIKPIVSEKDKKQPLLSEQTDLF
jgi:dTDP-4-dehydrorhamnose 3,5-epimerase